MSERFPFLSGRFSRKHTRFSPRALMATLLLFAGSAIPLIAPDEARAALIFEDNFNEGTDTALQSHTPDTGAGWTIIIQNGGGQLRVDASANNLDVLSGGFNDGVLYTADITGGYPTSDYEVSIDTVNGDTGDDWNYLAVRIQDANNMYVVQFNEDGGQIYKQTTAGGWVTLGAAFGAVADGSTVTFRVVGSTLTVLDDGTVVRTVMDTDITAAGEAGVGMGDIGINTGDDLAQQTLDTFLVSSLATISGKVYTDEGSTTMAANRTVAVSINGAAVAGTDDTDAGGNYSIAGLNINAGDVITLFIDDETENAVAVTLGTGEDMTVDLYEDYLITRADNGGTLTNANLDTANNSADTDINAIYTMSGTALTTVAGVELLVWTGDEFAPGDSVTTDNLDINGTFTMAGNDVTVSGGWDATGGRFTGTSGTVTLDASSGGTIDIISNSGTFGNLDINVTGGTVIELEDALTVYGTLSITQGTLDVNNSENNAITVGGGWDNSGTFTARAGTVTLTGTQALDITTNGDNFYNLTFNGSGSWELQDALDVNGDLTISAGTLDSNAASSFMINVAGDWSNSGSFLARSGTVAFDATAGSPTISGGSSAFNNLELTDGGNDITFTLEQNLDVDGTLKISGGNLDTKSGENNRINIAGNWINQDLFTARSGEVVFDGNDQTVFGSTVFYDFTKLETSNNGTDTILTFEAQQTTTVLGDWAVNGLDSDDRIRLRSTNPGAAPSSDWAVDPQGARLLSYLEVQNSDNVSGTTVDCTNNCMDDGDNTDWNFTSVPITITGTVYIDEGVTDIGSGITVAVSINGGAIDATDTTDANGGYSITTVSNVGATSILTLFLNDETENAVTVTNATGADMNGIDLYQDYLIIRNDNVLPLTNTNMDTANNVGDGDVDAIFTIPAASDLRTTNGTELLIPAGHTFEPNGDLEVGVSGTTSVLDVAGTLTLDATGILEVEGTMDVSGTFTAGGAAIDINGDLTVSAGIFTSTTGTLSVAGTIDLAAGTFTHSSGGLLLDGSTQQTVAAGSNTFNRIQVTNASGAGVIFSEAFTVTDFTNTVPNSTMHFQQNTTFIYNGDILITGSSGNLITIDSANATDRFTWEVSTSQEIDFVFVSNSEATENNIRCNNSSAGLNTDRLETAPHWIFASPSQISIATGRFTITTGTGDLSVTGVGFQPKAYVLFLTKNDTDDADSAEGTGLGSQLSVGMTDGTNQFCMTSGVEDDQGTSDVGRRGFETSQGSEVGDAVVCNIDVGSGGQDIRGEASHVSMDVDGFTINRSTAFTEPTNVLVQYIAFGGSDLNATVDLVNLNNTQDASVNVTGPGFEPDLVLTSYTGKYLDANGAADNDDDSISVGWAVNPSIQATNNQFSITKSSRDGQATATGQTRLDSARAGVAFRDGSLDASFEIENFDASGFDVTTRLAASNDNELMGYMALDIGSNPQVYSVSRTVRLGVGTVADEDARFEPIFLMGIGGAIAVDPDTNTSGSSLTIGITDGTTQFTMLLHDEDSVGTSNTHSRTTSTKFMSAYDDDGTIEWESELDSFDPNGWTLDYTDPTPGEFLNAFLAIGVEPAPVTIAGRAFSDEGVTPVAAGTKISVATNGGVRRQTGTTDASGNFDFTIITNPGDIITLWFDDEAEQGVTVSETDGNNLANFDLYQDRLILRHDNGGSLTNTDLDQADDVGDTDITDVFSYLGGTVTVGNAFETYIESGHTFVPGGNLDLGALDINGGLTMAGNQLTVSGTFDATGGSFSSTGDTIFDMTTTVTGTFNGSAFQNVTLNGANGTLVLEDDFDANGNVTITNGTLDANAGENNNIEVGGSWDNSDTFLPRGGSVTLDATSGSPTIDNGTSAFNNLSISDSGNNITFTLQGNLDINGDLNILDGNLDANVSGNYSITLQNDWSNSDTFTARNGTVTLDGTDQALVGSTTFYNLTKLETTNDSTDVTVTFDVTGSLAILNTWTFNGLDSDDQIIIEPDTPSTSWYINPQGVRAISYLDVTYSTNVSGTTISCTNGCTDNGNNIDWSFTANTITVSGSVFIDEGSTNIGSGTTVRLAVNGVNDNSDTTDANGGYSITSSALVGSGAVMTLYIDSGGGDAGVTVAIANGNDVSGVDIYRDYLIVRAENGGTVTNNNLDTANDNGDTDIDAIYTMSGTTLTVVNGNELFLPSGFAYQPSGDINIGTSGATTAMDINGTFTLGGSDTLTVRGTLDVDGIFTGSSATVNIDGDLTATGTFGAPTTTLTVSGTVDLAAGSYVHNSGIIEFDGSQQQTIAAGGNTFNHIRVANGSGPGVIFTEAFTTDDFTNTTVASAMTFQQSTTFTITDSLTVNGSSGNEITFDSVDGATRFTLDVTGGSQSLSYVNVSNSQTSSNNIIANNSTEGSNTDSAEAAPHWVFPAPVAISVDTGRFTLTTGTGNLSVTGVGFQPSAYILFLTKNDTDDANSAEGTGVGGMIAVGMTDGTRQFCMATGSEDNQGTSDVGRRGYTDEVLCNIDVGDAAQSERGEANHVSFDADGFTINRGVAFTEPTNILVEYIAFGGTDLTVRVDTVDLNDTQDADFDVTNVGFEPDVVLTSFIGHFLDADNDTDNDDHSFSFGWAVNPTLQSTSNQYSIMVASRDGQGTSQTVTRFDDTRAGTSWRDGSDDASYEINTFDASGFTVTTRLAAATTDEVMGYMALGLGSSPLVFSGERTALTTTGNESVTDPRFQPDILIGIGSAVTTSANTVTVGHSLALGMTDGTDTFAVSMHDQNSADVSNTHSRTTNTQFFSALSDSGAIDWEASFSSFDANGWTLNFGDGATAAFNVAYFAFGTQAAPTTVVGTVYTDEGVTDIGSGKTVALSINGAAAAQTSETDANGAFEFTIDTDAGDVVTVYLEDETEQAVTVSVSDGNLLSSFDLYQNYLIVRNDNGGSTTNTHLSVADDNTDTDITDLYTMTGTSLTVTDGIEFLIYAGSTYAPGDTVTADDVDVNGAFSMAANAITISGSFDATGGTVSSTGTVTFDAAVSRVILSGGNAFQHVHFNKATGTWVLEDAFDANGDVLITNGTLDVNNAENNSVNVGGYWLNNGSFLERTGTVTFDGTGSETITSNGGAFYNIQFNGATGTWVLEDALDVNGDLTITTGTLDINAAEINAITLAGSWDNDGSFLARTGTVTFDATAGSPTIAGGASAFYHVEFNDAGNGITWTLQEGLDVNGNLLITGGNLDVNASGNYTINAGGNWTNNDLLTAQTGTIIFDASAGTVDITPGASAFYHVQIDDGGGGATFEMESTLDINGTLSLTSGVLDANLTENNTLNVGGSWYNNGGTFTPRAATVVFDATAGTPAITSNAQAFYNLDFNDAGNNITFTLEDTLDVNGTLEITGGNLDTKSGENNSINVAGNWLNQDLFTARNGTVTLDAAAGSPTVTSGGQAFYHLDINDGANNVDFLLLDALDVNGTLMIVSGTLDVNVAGNYQINVGGGWSSADTFLARTGTVAFDATSGTPMIASQGQSFYNIDFDDAGNGITFTLEDTLDVNGTLRINGGTLDVKASENNDITVAGSWINNDMFAQQSGEVTLDGTDQSIMGTTTFYDLTKSETTDNSTDVTVTFDVTGSLVIENIWSFNGLDTDDRIVLQPSVALTQWDIDPQGIRAISYLDPTYSRNVNVTTVNCTNGCNDGGNNINWNFVAGIITVSGTVYVDEGVTDIGAGTTVRLDVNGAADNSDTTDANGGYSITSSVAVGSGAVLTLYLDTGGGDAGVSVVISDGNDAADIDIYRDYLIVRADNGAFVNNINLNTANNSGDTDIDAVYTMSSNAVTLVDGNELLVPSGKEYRPGDDVSIGTSGATSGLDINGTLTMDAGQTLTVFGTLDSAGVFTGSSATIDINGDLNVTTGTFTASSTTMTVAGTVDLAAGTYAANAGIILFDGAQQQTISAGGNTFNEIRVSNATSAGVIFDEAFTAANLRNTTPNARMRFQQSTTFTVTSNLTINGSSGNEIILDSVDGSTRFTFDVTGGTQTVSFVNVSNSQASTNNIIANNSTDNANTDSAEAAPQWIFVTQPNLLIDTGRFTLSSGTGNLAVTGIGFQPSAYILFLTKNATDDVNSVEGVGNGGMLSVGMTDGTRQFCMASGAEDDQSTSDVGRRGLTDMVVCNIDVGDESQNVLGEASHVSFDADGFTINRNVSFSEPANVLAQYIAFGGSDVSVYVGTVDLNDTVDSAVDVTAPGFEPDLVLSSYIGKLIDGTGNIANDDHSISFGWAVNPDVQASNNQLSITTGSRDLVTTSETNTRFDNVRAGGSFRDGAQDSAFEIGNFDASGFDVTTRLAGAEANELMGYMAMDVTGTAYIYSTTRPARTSSGNDIDGNAAFQPIFLLGVGSAVATAVNTDTDGGSLSIGMTDGTDTIAVSFHDQDNVGTTNTHTRTTTTQFMLGYGDDGTVDWESTLTSFDESGWTVNYGNAAGAAYRTGYLAIGLNAAPTTISGQAFQSDKSTSIGANKTVSLSINGGPAVQSVETDASGNFSFTVDTDPGDIVTIYFDDETEKGATVTVSSGGLLSTFNLFRNHLVVRQDNGGSLTNTNLATADNSGDTDITAIYTMTGNQLSVPDAVELFIPSGFTFAPGDVISIDNIEISGVFTPASTQLTTISGTFNANGGTITTTGTIFFNATTGIISITSNGQAVRNALFDDGGNGVTWQFTDAFDVNGWLQLDNGTLDFAANDVQLFVEGNVVLNAGTFLPGVTGTITFDGDKTFFDATMSNMGTLVIDPTTTLMSDLSCSSLTINSGDTLVTDGYEIDCSNDVTVNGTLDARPGTDGNTTINVGRDWDSGSGMLMMLSSTLIMDDGSGNSQFTSGSNTFYNVTFDDGNGGGNITWQLQDNLDVENDLSIVEGVLDVTTSNRNINVAGNWTNSDTFTERSGTVTFDGTAAQTIITCNGCNSGDFNNLVVTNGSGSAVAFQDSFSVVNFTATTADTSMTFEAGTTVTISGNLSMNGGAAGDEVILNSSDGATRFTFDVTAGDQTVSFVSVANSQASSNNITANSSIEGANTDSGEAAPHWIFPGGGPLRGAVIMVD